MLGMEKEQAELQFLGVFDIYKESCKLIFSFRKIFSQITLTLILPLSFIFLIHIEISNLLFGKIVNNTEQMIETPPNTPQYNKISDILSSEWGALLIFKLVYFTLILIFSLLSTSAVVYTIASIYTSRDVNFNTIMSVVPRVWKRLMLTLLCTFVVFFIYNFTAALLIIICLLIFGLTNTGIAILVSIGVVYFVGILYLLIVWQLSSVVSVLEESYGFDAMMKSRELIKGKMGLAVLVFLKLNVSFFLIQYLFKKFVVYGLSLSNWNRTTMGFLCFLLMSHVLLFALVIQTVLYFVCKSYHHENIDKSTLSEHLEVYLGEYEPLKTKDVQLENYQV